MIAYYFLQYYNNSARPSGARQVADGDYCHGFPAGVLVLARDMNRNWFFNVPTFELDYYTKVFSRSEMEHWGGREGGRVPGTWMVYAPPT